LLTEQRNAALRREAILEGDALVRLNTLETLTRSGLAAQSETCEMLEKLAEKIVLVQRAVDRVLAQAPHEADEATISVDDMEGVAWPSDVDETRADDTPGVKSSASEGGQWTTNFAPGC
jgi:hypothetical protein